MAHLNGLSQPEFVSIIGPVFENSPWIAESTWPKGPFADMADLHRALCAIVNQASEDKQLELILAHLRLAVLGELDRIEHAERRRLVLGDEQRRDQIAIRIRRLV